MLPFEGENPYKHLKVLGKTHYSRSYPSYGPNFRDKLDEDWIKFKQSRNLQTTVIDLSATYHMVRAKLQSVHFSIKKCDVPAIDPKPSKAIDTATRFCEIYLSYIRSEVFNPPGGHEYNLNTSDGLPWLKYKCQCGLIHKKKGELFDCAYAMVKVKELVRDLYYIPVDTYNDKLEQLPEEDLIMDGGLKFDEVGNPVESKVRGTFCTAVHFLAKEKFLFGGQNEKLVSGHSNSWIKYGGVKQYGGFNEMVKPLEKFSFRCESDVSGFDRTAYLKRVYYLRRKLLTTRRTPPLEELLDHVEKHNVNPTVLLPNGLIIERQTGNDSGRDGTASNNSILHLLILVYLFVRRQEVLGRAFDYEDIFRNVEALIYSDDKLMSFNLDYWGFETPEDYLSWEREIYAEFGMKIKKSSQFWTLAQPRSRIDPRHSFLGSYCHFSNGLYLPYPRFGKVCSSVIYNATLNSIGTLDKFQKLVNLTILSYSNPEIFTLLSDYVQWYMGEYPEFYEQYLLALDSADVDIAAKNSFNRIYSGYELSGF